MPGAPKSIEKFHSRDKGHMIYRCEALCEAIPFARNPDKKVSLMAAAKIITHARRQLMRPGFHVLKVLHIDSTFATLNRFLLYFPRKNSYNLGATKKYILNQEASKSIKKKIP